MNIIDSKNRNSLGEYYMDFPETVAYVNGGKYGRLDQYGIPVIDYDQILKSKWNIRNKVRYGIHHTPVTIAQYAFHYLLKYRILQKDEYLQVVVRQSDWLCNSLFKHPAGFAVWIHSFSHPSYNLTPPWVSAMAQGQGISALLRTWELTKDQRYLEAALQAGRAFLHDISEGGVSCRDENDCLWFEEYPSRPASHVLNGFIFALWGLFDLWRVTRDSTICGLWEKGVATLRINLPRYERNNWSRYDLIRNERAAYDYHLTHVLQLEVMAALTEEPLFKEYAQRWRQSAECANLSALSAMRLVRGGLRRAGLLPRPTVTGISVNVPVTGGDSAFHA